MNFIDHTGHIFSLPSYTTHPTGYEYDVNDYIFWINSEYSYKLSVGNYYIQPIRIAISSHNDLANRFTIELDSNIFSLLGSKQIDDAIAKIDESSKEGYIDLDNTQDTSIFKKTLTSEDINVISHISADVVDVDFDENHVRSNNESISEASQEQEKSYFDIITFYVVALSHDAATWDTNILIHINRTNRKTKKSFDEYCPITVGATFVDECEELIINGQNMGIYLPKDILTAVYETSYYNEVHDTVVYNAKLKEYLMNYAGIRAQAGNYNSVINSVKWFGWGDHITISKLFETDNTFITQYVHDNFNIDEDILDSFFAFKNSTMLALSVPENVVTDKYEDFDFDADFYGEGNPILEDLMSKQIIKHYDEENSDGTWEQDFYAPYYKYMFDELGLKLTAMKYYLEKYFLPIHLKIHSASIRHTAFTNSVKMLMSHRNTITQPSIFISDNNVSVEFPKSHHLYVSGEEHCVDRHLNEFSKINTESAPLEAEDYYYINTSNIAVPIRFNTKLESKSDQVYNVILKLYREGSCIYSTNFSFTQNEAFLGDYKNFIIYPKLINDLLGIKQYDLTEWINRNFELSLCVNGTWFTYKFDISMPILDIHMGKLVYKYTDDNKNFKQYIDDSSNFNLNMWQPDLVTINDVNYIDKVKKLNNVGEFITEYYDEINFSNKKDFYNHIAIGEIDNASELHINYDNYKSDSSLIAQVQHELENSFNKKDKYDLYLMRDDTDEQLYCVFISKETNIDEKLELNEVIELKSNTINDIYNDVDNISIKIVRTDERVLINRMDIEFTDGIDHFNQDDIVVACINNESNLSFNHDTQSKWEITPLSHNITNHKTIKSNSNIGIISMGYGYKSYEPGYYNITVNYNIDGVEDNAIVKTKKFLIKK